MASPKQKKPEKVQEEQPAAQPAEQAADKEVAAKKWKGKDWFTVTAPEMFQRREIGEVPATDAQTLVGRRLEVSLAELTGNPSRYAMKLDFKVTAVEGRQALTQFNGLNLVKDQTFRIVRKRTSKVEIVTDVETKDKWLLHLKLFAVLNRVCNAEVERKVRALTVQFLHDFASKSTIDDMVKTACDNLIQKNIKKFGSKLYPIRFCEIIKLEVKLAGSPG